MTRPPRSLRPELELLEDRRVPALFPAGMPLGSLDDVTGFGLNGEANYDQAGWSVARAGDVNGDGLADQIIGARFADAGGSNHGRAYIAFARTNATGSVNLSDLSGTNGVILNGEADNDQAGFAVAGAGDVNGDGFDDVIIGALYYGITNEGRAYVVFGRSSFTSPLDLSDLNGSNGFRLVSDSSSSVAGWSVAGAGDVNGDGFDDVLLGAPVSSPQVYLVFGRSSFTDALNLTDQTGVNGLILEGGDSFGRSVAGAGDVNGDDFDDIIIGCPGSTNRTFVLFGSANLTSLASPFDLNGLSGSNGFILAGVDGQEQAGWSVAGAGDVNGDGLDDLVIGAPLSFVTGINRGRVFVVFGRTAFSSLLALSSLSGPTGLILTGEADYDLAGASVAGAGDVNGDGFADVLIGARFAVNGVTNRGRAYVVYGRSSFTSPIDLSGLSGSDGFYLEGEAAYDQAGRSVAGAGDVNGDGVDDLLVGAPYADAGGTNRGRAYVVYGRQSLIVVGPDKGSGPLVKVFKPDGTLVGNILPYPVTFTGGVRVAVGDVTGDGQPDVVMTPGNGLFAQVQIWDGRKHQLLEFVGIQGFLAYGPNYLKGASVAVGDTDSDSIAEIVVSPDAGPNRAVKVFNGSGGLESSFFPYGPTYTGGVRIAVGNTQGSPDAEIVTVKASGAPLLRVFSANGTLRHTFANVVGNFVAVGDVDNDGAREIITGSGAGQPGRAQIYTGTTGVLEVTKTPYVATFTGGIHVGVVELPGQFNLLTGPGKGTAAKVNVFNGVNKPFLDSFFAYDSDFDGGIFVAGS